jgi:hypothetical protein
MFQSGSNLCRKNVKLSLQFKKTQIFQLEKTGDLNPGPAAAEVRFRTLNHYAKPSIILVTISPVFD